MTKTPQIDFDKVLGMKDSATDTRGEWLTSVVMDKGSIAEYASPAELLRDHKSKFYAVSFRVLSLGGSGADPFQLCKATGRTEFAKLKAMAKEAEQERTHRRK